MLCFTTINYPFIISLQMSFKILVGYTFLKKATGVVFVFGNKMYGSVEDMDSIFAQKNIDLKSSKSL